ncbi:cell division protein ZapA [Gilvimarinus sp. F26214L]|uniref:cell division protein ZapA n=1 Tax=Gilvimarinus sp. DZF01 TaxID=3461371 RepID=UPI0040453D2C
MSDNQTVTVNLLDKDYQIACPPEERDALLRAARSLDARLRAIRDGGHVVGLERIAIMAALNLSYELQAANDRSASAGLDEDLLQNLSEKVDRALEQLQD